MVAFHILSKAGGREVNEDNVGMFERGGEYCFALADGLGGHEKGELASLLAVKISVEIFAKTRESGEVFLRQAFQEAQETLLRQQKSDYRAADMKTTMVLLHIGRKEIRWGHIGDSRLYYFLNGKLEARSLDHSVPQLLVLAGKLKERQIRHHPDRNRLLKVLGADWEEPKYQLAAPVERKGKMAFLLCSDGFWEWIDEKKMRDCLKRAVTPEEWLSRMEKIVLKNGSGVEMDNYSAVAVWLEGEM